MQARAFLSDASDGQECRPTKANIPTSNGQPLVIGIWSLGIVLTIGSRRRSSGGRRNLRRRQPRATFRHLARPAQLGR